MDTCFNSFIKRSYIFLTAFALVFLARVAGAGAATVTPTDDSYISYESTGSSYGSGTELVVKTRRNISTNASYAAQEAVLEFTINATDHATNAAIYLDVSTYDEAVTADFKTGDLIVFAPRWLDPVGRRWLGSLLTVADAGRLDDARYARVWEVSIRGAGAGIRGQVVD